MTSRAQDAATAAPRLGLWQATLFYSALTLLYSFPLWVHPASTVLWMGSDTELFAWTLAWDVRAFTHAPWSIFDANIFYPQQNTLALSENLIGSAFFAAPVLWLTHNPVLALNVVALLSCVLCGVGTYLLGRRLGLGWLAAGLAGMVFAFAPPRFFRLGQLHLTTVQWLPFGLASLHAYLDDGRKRDLRLATAFFTLQALTSGHGTVFLLGSMAALFAWRLLLGEPLAIVRRVRDFGLTSLLLLAPTALILLPYHRAQVEMGLRRTLELWWTSWASFLASPSHVDQWLLSFVPQLHVMERADALLFPGIAPILLALVALLPRRGAKHPGEDAAEGRRGWVWAAFALDLSAVVAAIVSAYAAVGGPFKLRAGEMVFLSVRSPWRPAALLVVAVALRLTILRRVPFAPAERFAPLLRWRQAHRRDAVLFYALLVLGTLWLALPPPVGIWPLVYWLPGLNFIRVPARFTILALLGLSVLAGFGAERLMRFRLPGGSAASAKAGDGDGGAGLRAGNVGAGGSARDDGADPRTRNDRAGLRTGLALGLLLAAEFAAMPMKSTPFRIDAPAIDRWLDGQAKPFAVAEVPVVNPRNIGPSERRQSTFMVHSMAHWQKTVHGFSGMRPGLHDELFTRLATFPDEPSIAALRRIGVKYVVVHTDFYPPGQWAGVEERLGSFGSSLRLEHVEGAGRVYSLAPPSQRP